MPALANQGHEAFAQAIAKGQSVGDAFRIAGYGGNVSNATRLNKDQKIIERVAELRAKKAEKLIDRDRWEPVKLFDFLRDLIDKAVEAGDFKAAMDGAKFLIRCFGFEDSATLTHEMVRGQSLNQGQVAEITEERAKEAWAEMGSNVVKALRAARAAVDSGDVSALRDITPTSQDGAGER